MSIRRQILMVISVLAMACSSVQAQQEDQAKAETVSEAKDSPQATPDTPKPAETDTAAEQPDAPKLSAPDPKVLAKIGAASLDIIAGADRVELVEVAASKNPDVTKHLQEHEIKSAPISLSAADIGTIRDMVFTKATHVLSARARCRFRPKHGLIFYKGEQKTSVLIAAPRCSKWSFEATPKRKIIDIRKAAGSIVAELIEKIKGGASK